MVGAPLTLDLAVVAADTMVVVLVVHQLEMVLKVLAVDRVILTHHTEVLL